MNKTGCACAVAAMLAFPAAAAASGSFVTIEAARSSPSIIHMGTPAPCGDEPCAETAEAQPETGASDAVKVDSVAFAAGSAALETAEPPVALGEITASVTPDTEDTAEKPMTNETPELFSGAKLRPGF